MKNKIEHKTYGESKLEIPHGWHTETEIEKMLETVRTHEKLTNAIFKSQLKHFNGALCSIVAA